MKFDEKESYVFEIANKNELINNLSKDFFTRDCTVLARFTPDFETMQQRYDEHNRYVGCVVGKNGHHMGVMVEAHTTAEGYNYRSVSFEYWVNVDEGMDIRQIQFTIPEENYDQPIEFILKRRDNKFIAEYNGEVKEGDCTNLADYSFSMVWIGAANRIVEDHNHIFLGDIDILHLQETYLDDEYCKLFFRDFDKFLPIAKNPNNIPIYTGDFKDTTPYRIKDLSGNGNHPIIFRKEWMM
jgi:hypothetical protein